VSGAVKPTGASALRRFKPYPAYKDSGVEWLGQIPTHWQAKRLKYVAPIVDERSSVATSDLPYVGLENIESGMGRLTNTSETSNPEESETSNPEEEAEAGEGATATLFQPGDVLFGKLRPYLAKVLTPNFPGRCSTELLVFRSTTDLVSSVLAYQLLSKGFINWVNALTYGAKMPRANPNQVADIPIALAPLSEQRAIAAFLDRETAKIDVLVAQKERLIALLQEKRAALIAKATIHGFNQNIGKVPTMSALFPEIPEPWKLRKLRRIIQRVKRPVFVEDEEEYREIGIRSWGRGIFHKDPVRGALLEDKSVFYVEPDDLVLNIVFAWEGAVAVVSERETGMIASHRFPTFRHSEEVDLDYLLMVLQSEQGRAIMGINSPGAAGRNRTIRIDQFLDEEVPLPPLAEQKEIISMFRAEERRLEGLLAKIRNAISLLAEARTTLISAAVTGKIDVREEVAT
jgi:type I restriction enzyme S subunit